MQISQSLVGRTFATLVVALVFVFLYETTIRDSRYAARQATVAEATGLPQAGAQLAFTATAYCKGETTASGVVVRTGIAAADSSLLPVGTVVRVDMPNSRYSGIWTVMDTGPAVQGRLILAAEVIPRPLDLIVRRVHPRTVGADRVRDGGRAG